MRIALVFALSLGIAAPAAAQDAPERNFTVDDLFGLTVAADPQISPDGRQIAYVRRTNDIMTDAAVSSIWLVDASSGAQTPLVTGEGSHTSPRWSPDGTRLAYVSTESGGGPELHVRWMASGESANITALPEAPGAISWSPDGTRIAYSARVPGEGLKLGKTPTKPEGAEWKAPLQIIDKVTYRFDGGGYARPGTSQLFVVDATGGAPRQLTFGEYDNGGSVEWSPDGRTLLFSANRREDWELEPYGVEIYALDVASGGIRALTSRTGPDFGAQYSPDGRRIAYLGFDDLRNAFDQTNLYVMDADGSNSRRVAASLDRGIDGIEWTDAGLFASFEEDGEHRVARIGLNGNVDRLPARIGSTYYALPYTGGEWSVSDHGTVAFTTASATRPTDIGVTTSRGTRQLTQLNELKFSGKALGETRELSVTAPDGTTIPAWIMLPPGYVEGTRVPMVLEMHGGPYAAYGPEFSVDYQLYGAAGYAVVFSNPGGSTGYGEAFADRIEDNYPISNFDELMAVVDAAIAEGYVDPDDLYVTGGSGGGVLTAWLVGKTDRFKAAATHKPVINWTSQALMADGTPFFGRYWLGALPWEDQAQYWERSPLSLVGNVKTPTLVLVGSEDYRTPRSEAEQYYGALKLAGVDTALVITPGSSHNNLSQSPSQQAARTTAVIDWFDKYRKGEDTE
ncbi:S9 family peptidase [Qipengyuania gelatinilytica]|uniref:S9 family peptidase n=1 Tax=Qipengyuania gelatinilytica TaxID=2867231 RepID=A0ABX8ZYU7_9SPHN|nr:S9 family peptidase [Qipengyuania gelatinilytica]QZD94191.1 S9 family peptidase [Qipengyuania gelatinilytica]